MLSYKAIRALVRKGETTPAGLFGMNDSMEFSLLDGKPQTPKIRDTKNTNKKRKKNSKRNKRKGKK